ncbi:MAG: hypothetical protein GX312_03645 [Candidatus Phytoplasma sp.]|nr:hypothetical protein [Phytoplasma sp.]
MGKKSNAAFYLNIIIIVFCLLPVILLYAVNFLEVTSLYSWALTSIIVFFCIAPYREIKKHLKRYDIIISKKGNQLILVSLDNQKYYIQINDIMKIKKYKVPIITFGTLVFYTQNQKYVCKYISNINQVYQSLELRTDEGSENN